MRPVLILIAGVLALSVLGCTSKKSKVSTLADFDPPDDVCEIAPNGLSPDGQTAFIYIPPQPDSAYTHFRPSLLTSFPFVRFYETDNTAAFPAWNFLMIRSFPGKAFKLPTRFQEISAIREDDCGIVRWASDSSAAVIFINSDDSLYAKPMTTRRVYDIYVVPIIHGIPGQITDLKSEILDLPRSVFEKAAEEKTQSSHSYSSISDLGLEDNFTFNDTNQLVVDCYCSNLAQNSDNDLNGESCHVTALWDPLQRKFVKSNITRFAAPETK